LLKEGSILEIGVKREHRRKGIGKAILLRNLDWLRSEECSRTIVNVDSDNFPALKLYEAAGFRTYRIKEKRLEKILNHHPRNLKQMWET